MVPERIQLLLAGAILASAVPGHAQSEAPPGGFSRIVSLNPDFTQSLVDLGAGNRLAGITRFCPAVTGARTVGDLREIDAEAVLALNPDLVLATRTGNFWESVDALRRLGLPVRIVERPRTLDQFEDYLREMGALSGREEAAEILCRRLDRQREIFRKRAQNGPRPRVFFELDDYPVYFSVGKETMIGELIGVCGGINVCEGLGEPYPSLDAEQVVALAPDVVVVSIMGTNGEAAVRRWLDSGLVPAARRGRVYRVDPDLVCRLGAGLLEGMRELAECIHPEWSPAGEDGGGEE